MQEWWELRHSSIEPR